MPTQFPEDRAARQRYIQDRVFYYKVKEYKTPYDDLMMQDQPMHQHLVLLDFIVTEFNVKTVLELGTQSGYSTIGFATGLAKTKGHLYSVDIAPCPLARDKMAKRGFYDIWTFYEEQNDLTLPWSKKVDLLFIDALHTYDHIMAELKKFEKYVNKGGFILIHDNVVYPDVEQAIDEYFENKGYREYRWFNDCGLQVFRK